ncbi:hypothetical protein LCGC14_2301790 [marine sediment metagenome]|uniref:Uncharacterized protein n=1 Tax=marine sediment metagenome TaxID=412755 RepID=A0A0F9F0Q4_9ZZZZ
MLLSDLMHQRDEQLMAVNEIQQDIRITESKVLDQLISKQMSEMFNINWRKLRTAIRHEKD